MDKRLKSIAENFDNMVVGLDDTFRFHCTICGKCCIHREDIILSPFDLFRVAKALNKVPHEVLEEYCETYIGDSSKMVIVKIKPRGSNMRCPFLKELKCSIHKSKPAVCAMYPIGRTIHVMKTEKVDLMQAEVKYIFQKPTCGDKSETHTVREWLSDFDLLENEEYFKTWMQLVLDLGDVMRSLETQLTDRTIDALAQATLVNVYLNYDINEPFMPQFLENTYQYRKKLSTLLSTFGIDNHLND